MTGPQNRPPASETEARKLRERYSWLNRFTDDEIAKISFCYEGESLKQDDDYFDISNPEKGVVKGRTGELVGPGSCLVSKSSVSPTTWSKLTQMP